MLTYNREDLVSQAIESILLQTLPDYEFIIVDNGSRDRSGVIADTYAEKDLRLHVIHQARGNIGSGRNTGLNEAKGEYITFIDDDDVAELDLLDFLYNLAIINNAEVAICGAFDKVFNEKRIMTAEEALIELMWRRRFNMAFPTKLFHRSLVEDLRFPEEGKYDDIALMYKLLAKPKRIAYHGLPKYTFVRHENNNSAWTTNHKLLHSGTLDEYLRVYRERTDWLSARFPNSSAAFRYFEWSFMISMVEKIHRLGIQGCNSQLNILTRELKKNAHEFFSGNFALEYEKEWMRKYILLP